MNSLKTEGAGGGGGGRWSGAGGWGGGVGYKQCPCKSIDTVRGGAMSSRDSVRTRTISMQTL